MLDKTPSSKKEFNFEIKILNLFQSRKIKYKLINRNKYNFITKQFNTRLKINKLFIR